MLSGPAGFAHTCSDELVQHRYMIRPCDGHQSKETPMNALKCIPSLAAAAALAATAIGLTAGLAPASAAPPQSGANLTIITDPANGANYRVTVNGKFSMDEYDAHGFINNLGTGARPGGVDYGITADDPDSNDEMIGLAHQYRVPGPRPGGYLIAQSDGIYFFQEISVPKGDLNEDDGVFDDTDEIYVQVNFVDGDGGIRTAYSNAVSGTF